jgi:hypothetical protein
VLAGHDACPMGVRIMGVKKRLDYDVPALYELAATRMEGWQKWCGRGHPGGKYPGHLPARHHYVAHYNQGNPAYAPQVLALRRTFLGKEVLAGEALTPRTLEIIRRYRRIYNRSRS